MEVEEGGGIRSVSSRDQLDPIVSSKPCWNAAHISGLPSTSRVGPGWTGAEFRGRVQRTGQGQMGYPDHPKFLSWRGSVRRLGCQLEASLCFPMGLKPPARRLVYSEPGGWGLPLLGLCKETWDWLNPRAELGAPLAPNPVHRHWSWPCPPSNGSFITTCGG